MIELVTSLEQIQACCPMMLQLRPHLQAETLVEQVQQQLDRGYQLAYLKGAKAVVAVAGFHIATNLAWGRHLYIEDLVVDADVRSQQYGEQLFQWLVEFAKHNDCTQLHLDSGVQRFDAHRFYLKQRMKISSHHFALLL